MNKIKQFASKLITPLFAPLRRFVIWGDTRFGTCTIKLTTESRWKVEE
jgi:hypothetical protein